MPRRGVSPTTDSLDGSLKDAQAQLQKKEGEVHVQAKLEVEKEVELAQAQDLASKLRKRANQLREEADVMAKIAKEKADAVAEADKSTQLTQAKADTLQVEEREMQRVLNQTKMEEITLERNVSNFQRQLAEEAKATAAKNEPTSAKARLALSASVVNTKPAAAPEDKSSKKPTVGALPVAQNPAAGTQPANSQALQKLLDENNRLKQDKAELQHKLLLKTVAKEKATLKQNLKNRLALADRSVKLKKRLLRASR